MEIETISEDGKKALVGLLNKSIQVEYSFILNYPRMMDYFINYEKFNDEIFLSDLEKLGKDSSIHLGWIVDIIKKLGGEPAWQINTIERSINALEMGNQQLEKEKMALEFFKEAIRLVRRNMVKTKVIDSFGKFIRTNKNGRDEEVVEAGEVINSLERMAIDENNHIKKVHDMLATVVYFKNKEA